MAGRGNIDLSSWFIVDGSWLMNDYFYNLCNAIANQTVC